MNIPQKFEKLTVVGSGKNMWALLMMMRIAGKQVRTTFCVTGHAASTGDYDICCARTCGVCAEPQCRERPGGPLNCCPVSGILASREECRNRRDESCALRRPESKVFRHFRNGNTSGTGDVHVVVTGDHMHYVGVVAAASSIFSTTTTPERIKLHVIAEDTKLDALRAALECTLPNATDWDIVIFEASRHMPNLTIRAPNNEQKGNLAADLNYARFYLPELLPGVDKVVYLDADTIVVKDICKLFDTSLLGGDAPVIAAVSREFKSVCFSLIYCDDARVRDFLSSNGIRDPERDLNFFNAGVIVFHLGRWADRGLTKKAEFWIRANSELGIYSLGSNPPLILAVGSHFEDLDAKWNCDGFGFKRPTSVTHECQVDAGIRHWSGHLKPWRRDGKYKMFWYPYVSDLNCMLLLDYSAVKYAPPPELPLRLRAVSPSDAELPVADRLPVDYVDPSSEPPKPVEEKPIETPPPPKKELAVVSGDTERHRRREYAGVIEVVNEMQRSINMYKSVKKNARQFVERLRSHHAIRWAPRVRDAKLRNRKVGCNGVDHVLVIVHNNSLYVDSRQYGPRSPCGTRPPDAAMATFKFLYSMRDLGVLPNTIFILCIDPRGTTYSDVPVFAYGKAHGYEQPGVLVPNPYFGRNHVHRWERIAKQFEEAASRHPWEDRISRVMWRGQFATASPSLDFAPGGPPTDDERIANKADISTTLCNDAANQARLEAIALTHASPQVFDMRIADGFRDAPIVFAEGAKDCKPPAVTPREIRNVLERAASSKLKSALVDFKKERQKRPTGDAVLDPAEVPPAFHNIDAATRNLFTAKWSGRMSSMANKFVASLPDAGDAPPASRNEIWLLGSAVLLWRSPAVEWYYPALADGITHATVDLENAKDLVRELIADDNRAQRLAFEAAVVHDNHLCSACIIEYWVELLNKYNARFGLNTLDIPSVIRELDAKRVRL